MILAKAPLRISFFGGSSDLPDFYLKHIGHTISMAIDKYVYVTAMETPHNHIKVSYSKQETVTDLDDIQNEIVRESLRYFGIYSNIEITTFASIPTIGTGLGGSSAFTCALVRALAEYKGQKLNSYDVAEIACDIEIKFCEHNIGKQDQYAAAFGGMLHCQFGVQDQYGLMNRVLVNKIDPYHIDKYCILIPTLVERDTAHSIIDSIDLKKQEKNISHLKQLAESVSKELPDPNVYGLYLDQAWTIKKKTSPLITNEEIDKIYRRCISAGAYGCKLLGAGGGGYMLAITENRAKIQNEFSDRTCLTVQTEEEGAKVVYSD